MSKALLFPLTVDLRSRCARSFCCNLLVSSFGCLVSHYMWLGSSWAAGLLLTLEEFHELSSESGWCIGSTAVSRPTAHVWKTKDSFLELILSILNMGSNLGPQVCTASTFILPAFFRLLFYLGSPGDATHFGEGPSRMNPSRKYIQTHPDVSQLVPNRVDNQVHPLSTWYLIHLLVLNFQMKTVSSST